MKTLCVETPRRRLATARGEEGSVSVLAVFGGTDGADDHFLDDFLALPTRIIRVAHFAFARFVCAKERVGPRTVRVLLVAPFQDNALAGSPGRHDALTQLTAKHGIEPMD